MEAEVYVFNMGISTEDKQIKQFDHRETLLSKIKGAVTFQDLQSATHKAFILINKGDYFDIISDIYKSDGVTSISGNGNNYEDFVYRYNNRKVRFICSSFVKKGEFIYLHKIKE